MVSEVAEALNDENSSTRLADTRLRNSLSKLLSEEERTDFIIQKLEPLFNRGKLGRPRKMTNKLVAGDKTRKTKIRKSLAGATLDQMIDIYNERKCYYIKRTHKIKKVIEKPLNQKKYDGEKKNKCRDMVCKYFNKYGAGIVLALESPQMLLTKQLSHHSFVIYENNKIEYKKMINNLSPNIEKFIPGDISKAIQYDYSYAFLDFCNTFSSNLERMVTLSSVLENTSYIALTFCTRGHKQIWGDEKDGYKKGMIRYLQAIFKSHTYQDDFVYKDTTPMICFILKNRVLLYEDLNSNSVLLNGCDEMNDDMLLEVDEFENITNDRVFADYAASHGDS